MDRSEFMTGIVAHYGPYKSDISERIVLKYIIEYFPENQLENIFSKLTMKYSNQYKTPPDPAKFEEIFGVTEQRIEAQALKHFSEITKKVNSYSDILFEDPRLQAAIQGMGGWIQFCQRPSDPESETWARKEFIKLYKLYSDDRSGINQVVLKGLHSGDRNVIMYGDRKKCELILEDIGQHPKQIENLTNGMLKQIQD